MVGSAADVLDLLQVAEQHGGALYQDIGGEAEDTFVTLVKMLAHMIANQDIVAYSESTPTPNVAIVGERE